MVFFYEIYTFDKLFSKIPILCLFTLEPFFGIKLGLKKIHYLNSLPAPLTYSYLNIISSLQINYTHLLLLVYTFSCSVFLLLIITHQMKNKIK